MQYLLCMSRFVPWLVFVAVLAVLVVSPAGGQTPSAEVEVRADIPLGPWEAGRFSNLSYAAGYGTTVSPESEHAFRWIRTTGAVEYVRCATWLGDGIAADEPESMAGASVYELDANGQPVYRWERLDRALDVILSSGARPVIVCGGVPNALAEGRPRYGVLGAAVNLPRDYDRYRDLVRELVRHLERVYGAAEVRRWYFEVWTGPDHAAFWEDGRRPPFTSPATEAQVASFLRLYDHFVAGATEADPRLRLGGPGLWGDRSFLRRFLDHCARGARLDFLSWQVRGTAAEIAASAESIRAEVARDFPTLSRAEMVVSGWSGPVDEPEAGTLGPLEAARTVALADLLLRQGGTPPRLFRWGTLVADHFEGRRPVFARLGPNTAPLPVFRAMQWLRQMGPERVTVTASGGVGAVAARTREGGVQVLLYRLDENDPAGLGDPVPTRVRVTGLPARLVGVPLRVFMMDRYQANVYGDWIAAARPRPAPGALTTPYVGRPELPPFQEELAYPTRNGAAEIPLQLRPNSVALLVLGRPPAARGFAPRGRAARVLKAEGDYHDASRLFQARDYERAALEYRDLARRYPDVFWSEVALASLARLYDDHLRQTGEAERVWRELLARPIDEVERLAILRHLLLLASRRMEVAEAQDLRRQTDALEADLDRRREWDVRP